MLFPGDRRAATPALPSGSEEGDVVPCASRRAPGSRALRAAVFAVVVTLVANRSVWAQTRTWEPRPTDQRAATPWVLPAEFERQEAVLITWDANDGGMQTALVDVVAAAWSRVSFLILVPHAMAEGQARRALIEANVPPRAVRFLRVPTDSVWTRDFGPQVVLQRDGVGRMIDCDYGHGDRVGDDLVPAAIAPTLGMRTLRPPITADGGNIQTNGRGLALTTTSILDHNVDRRYTPEGVAKVFRDYYGITDLVFLEPLVGESTGHVDMFAVFIDADTVVVGQYDPREDPVNHELLERNVARLQRVRGPRGPLRIVRIPMPPKDEKNWRTYTNVLFANGTLLIPQYPDADRHGHSVALATYRKLLPGWTVVGIDCSRLIRWGGAIHCMTMNLARVPTLEEQTGRGPSRRDEIARQEFSRNDFSNDDDGGFDFDRDDTINDRARQDNDARPGADHGFSREIGDARPARPYRPYRRLMGRPPRSFGRDPDPLDDRMTPASDYPDDRERPSPAPDDPSDRRFDQRRVDEDRREDDRLDDRRPDEFQGGYGAYNRRRLRSSSDDDGQDASPQAGYRARPNGSGRMMFVPDSRRPAGAARIEADAFSADR